MILQHRIAALIVERRGRAVKPRGAFDHLVQALLQEIAHVRRDRLRAVPRSCAVCGMTLSVWPAWNMQIDTTAAFSGSTLRATIDWIWLTICAPTSTVSIAQMRARRMAALALDVDRRACRPPP